MTRFGALRGFVAGRCVGSRAATRSVRVDPVPLARRLDRSSSQPSRQQRYHDLMEKRVLLAVVLSFVVSDGCQAMFPPPQAASRRQQATATPRRPRHTRPGAQPVAAQPNSPHQPPPQPAAPARRDAVASGTSLSRTPSCAPSFTTRGAVAQELAAEEIPGRGGQPLELVPQTSRPAPSPVHALGRRCTDVAPRCEQALFKPSADSADVGPRQRRWRSTTRTRAGLSRTRSSRSRRSIRTSSTSPRA